VIKRTRKESDKVAKTNSAKIYQNRTTDKGQFFKGFYVAQSKSVQLMKVWI
jgi:hypothetical protein